MRRRSRRGGCGDDDGGGERRRRWFHRRERERENTKLKMSKNGSGILMERERSFRATPRLVNHLFFFLFPFYVIFFGLIKL